MVNNSQVRCSYTTFLMMMLLIVSINYESYAQHFGINSTGATPDASAILDIVSLDKGLLIPRVTLTDVTVASSITSPTTSLDTL